MFFPQNVPGKTLNSLFFPFCLQENRYMATEFAFRQSSRINPKSLPKTCQRWVSLCPWPLQIRLLLHCTYLLWMYSCFLFLFLKMIKLAVSVPASGMFWISKKSVCVTSSPFSLVFGITPVSSESSSEVSDHHVGSWSSWILWPQPGTTRYYTGSFYTLSHNCEAYPPSDIQYRYSISSPSSQDSSLSVYLWSFRPLSQQ